MMNRCLFVFLITMLLAGNVVWGQSERDAHKRSDAVYERYESRQDLTVAQILNYPVDSNVCVSVVMLQADNEGSWEELMQEFGVASLSMEQKQSIKRNNKVSAFMYKQADNPTMMADMQDGKVNKLKSCIVIAAYDAQTLWIFHYNTEKEALKIFDNYYDKQF